MSLFARRRNREVPGLNTASLPDLIFSVLFFFMIVTHMRQETLKVRYQVPKGTQLTRLTKKSTISHVYIGEPSADMASAMGKGTRIQYNDKYVTPQELARYLADERARMAPDDRARMIVSLKGDLHTKMSVVQEVKQALRQAKEIGNTPDRELAILFVHGLLHLLGYDHMKKEDEEIMFPLQEKILAAYKEKKEG